MARVTLEDLLVLGIRPLLIDLTPEHVADTYRNLVLEEHTLLKAEREIVDLAYGRVEELVNDKITMSLMGQALDSKLQRLRALAFNPDPLAPAGLVGEIRGKWDALDRVLDHNAASPELGYTKALSLTEVVVLCEIRGNYKDYVEMLVGAQLYSPVLHPDI